MRKSDGFLFVYDVTKRDSIFELDEFYKEIQRTKDEAPFSVVLCGNKSDIEERGKDAVDKKMAKGLKLFLIPRIHRSLFRFYLFLKRNIMLDLLRHLQKIGRISTNHLKCW
jgi:GTPase SAR1 family protein